MKTITSDCSLYAILASLFFASITYGQTANENLKENGIYLTSTDFQQHYLTFSFDKNEDYKFKNIQKHTISIKRPLGEQTFYKHEIWGYRKEGVDWRFYNSDSYRVDYNNEICIYTSAGNSTDLTSTWTYFSKSLTSSIYPLTRASLTALYHSDTAFCNKIKDLSLLSSIEKWDKEKKRLKFIDWLTKN